MRRTGAVALMIVLAAATTAAQEVTSRPWQQRLHAEIPLPVPMVAVEAANPFSVSVDTMPELLGSVAPRKMPVSGRATAAAYVDTKGVCLGAVPLDLPFPGLTSALIEELRETRFEPARSGTTTRPSWAVVSIGVNGKVKESTVLDQSFELPDPLVPPRPKVPPQVSPPGNLINLPTTPQSELSALATPRRVNLRVPGRLADIALEALVHVTAEGRCDRFVPLDLDPGFRSWLSAFLASWRMKPAQRDGEPVDSWVVYRARVQMKLSSLESTAFRTDSNRSYDPNEQQSQ